MRGLKFTYYNDDGTERFSKALICARCTGRTAAGNPCTRTTCKMLPYCWQHARSELGLIVKPSNIPGAGLGLFTDQYTDFLQGDYICPIDGERVQMPTLNQRYGQDKTAPYAVPLDHGWYVDGAAKRWIGQAANTAIGANGHVLQSQCNAIYTDPNAQNKIWLQATRAIPPNTEILVNYGDEYTMDGDFKTHIARIPPRPPSERQPLAYTTSNLNATLRARIAARKQRSLTRKRGGNP